MSFIFKYLLWVVKWFSTSWNSQTPHCKHHYPGSLTENLSSEVHKKSGIIFFWGFFIFNRTMKSTAWDGMQKNPNKTKNRKPLTEFVARLGGKNYDIRAVETNCASREKRNNCSFTLHHWVKSSYKPNESEFISLVSWEVCSGGQGRIRLAACINLKNHLTVGHFSSHNHQTIDMIFLSAPMTSEKADREAALSRVYHLKIFSPWESLLRQRGGHCILYTSCEEHLAAKSALSFFCAHCGSCNS